MKVLHVFKVFYPDSYGGIEQVIRQLIQSPAAGSTRAAVFTLSSSAPSQPAAKIIEGMEVWQAPLDFSFGAVPLSYRARPYFKKALEDVDLIHYHYPWPMADLLHGWMGRKIPSVLTYHADIVRHPLFLAMYRPLKHRFLNAVDQIVATSEEYLNSSVILNQYKAKTKVIPLGIDPQAYPLPREVIRTYWRERFPVPFVLFVGVLRTYKGLTTLIEAAKNVRGPVVILGDGPMQSSLQLQVKELGINNVIFLGALPDEDKMALIALARLVVLPSDGRNEAFGVSLLEAAMLGRPMVSTALGTGSCYVNQHGNTGWVVPPKNPLALAKAINDLLNDEPMARQMGLAAQERFHKLFLASQMVKSYHSIYQNLLGVSES